MELESSQVAEQPRRESLLLLGPQLSGLSMYYLTGLIVIAGVGFGTQFLTRQGHPNGNEGGFVNAFGNWDGVWYSRIARGGYSYNSGMASSVAFFPVYPLLGSAVSGVTGLSEERSLLILAHVCLICTFIMTSVYVRGRYRAEQIKLDDWVLLAMGLWPTTFFFRMAYSESLFVLLLLWAMSAMQQRWPAIAIALIVGVATACRPTGIALLPPLAVYLWQRRTSKLGLIGNVAMLLPLACWGIVAYVIYQYVEYGDALAFVKTQTHWAVRQPASLGKYVLALVTLEPIWSKYHPGSVTYWARQEPIANPLFSLEFANPIYFMLTAALIAVGARKRWLNSREVLLSFCLLAIPYLTHSYRAGMMGHARYAAAVFPAYLVMGQLLARMPPSVTAILLAMSGFLLGVYSALFAAWYRFI